MGLKLFEVHIHGKYFPLGLEIAVAADLLAQGSNGLCTEAVTFFRVLGDAVIIENHISVKGVSDYDSCL